MWTLPVTITFICIVSLFLLLGEAADLHKPDAEADVDQTVQHNAPASPPRSMLIYSAVAIGLILALCFGLQKIYPENSFWVNLKRMTLLAVMWPMAYVDFKSSLIPNRMLLWGIICRAFILAAEVLFDHPLVWWYLKSECIAAGAIFLVGVLSSICTHKGLGAGDIKLFVVMGLLLGLDGIWGAVFFTLVPSMLYSMYLLIFQKKSMKSAYPFAPFLTLGTYLSVFLTGM